MRRGQRARWIGWLAWANAVAMGLVLLLGTTVTATGSGFGCGESWPLCHGRLLPPLTLEGVIEYSHRLATLVSGLVLVALLLLVALERRQVFARWETRIVAGLLVGTLLIQSALGALAVLAPRYPPVMAVHFGVSLTVFASALLLALILTRGESLRERRRVAPPGSVSWASWGLLVGTYAVVYLGAYVRHANASLACLDWPLCQGKLVPDLAGPTGIVFLHRSSALLLTLALTGLVVRLWRDGALRRARPDIVRSGTLALLLLLAQSATGAWVVFSRLSLDSILAHAAVVTLLFGALAVLAYQALPVRVGTVRRSAAVAEPVQVSR
ncbi:COX15/CtaA family protein [Thermomicrobium sp. 4228-Ro]|uniref:COX15/CtaA family protein n=1 Tax=Thermomicrobium sp. 4228-Ro TaxID=2993937 RepID=UPI002249009E|nr:COX15/CtaA family protein [Thermomicrobium sp. 4228-Ro]MCX2728151.1 COX15/CtaA family protein [Thermomicrobium sp. 4228-Ro]